MCLQCCVMFQWILAHRGKLLKRASWALPSPDANVCNTQRKRGVSPLYVGWRPALSPSCLFVDGLGNGTESEPGRFRDEGTVAGSATLDTTLLQPTTQLSPYLAQTSVVRHP